LYVGTSHDNVAGMDVACHQLRPLIIGKAHAHRNRRKAFAVELPDGTRLCRRIPADASSPTDGPAAPTPSGRPQTDGTTERYQEARDVIVPITLNKNFRRHSRSKTFIRLSTSIIAA
jgi:hypothetical protein